MLTDVQEYYVSNSIIIGNGYAHHLLVLETVIKQKQNVELSLTDILFVPDLTKKYYL